jgi:hypothetical protein
VTDTTNYLYSIFMVRYSFDSGLESQVTVRSHAYWPNYAGISTGVRNDGTAVISWVEGGSSSSIAKASYHIPGYGEASLVTVGGQYGHSPSGTSLGVSQGGAVAVTYERSDSVFVRVAP